MRMPAVRGIGIGDGDGAPRVWNEWASALIEHGVTYGEADWLLTEHDFVGYPDGREPCGSRPFLRPVSLVFDVKK